LQGDFAEISQIIFVSKETGQLEKIQQFQLQFPQLGQPRAGWIFSSESTCPGLSNVICHFGVLGRACL
jgi:hypothetical protein